MSSGKSRRGRLPAAERERREAAVLTAAEQTLLEVGEAGTTMLAIAQRAGASKETLYSWFGSRDGLFAAMIEQNADRSAAAIATALDREAPTRDTLIGFGVGLLSLLTSPSSIALNRAAMASLELARVLLESGRHRVGPLVEEYLGTVDEFDLPDTAVAFETFYGLLVRDTQIRVLLGESTPSKAAVKRRATEAVDQFMALFAR